MKIVLDAGNITTRKLYDEDPYATRFEAVVKERSGYEVVLDQTLFFPEEGGQTADRGSLGGFPVKDVRIRGGVIRHILEVPAEREGEFLAHFAEGNAIDGEIDWEERFSNMQQHSGEHIFSGIVNRRFGYNNVGFHLSAREVTLDFDGVITKEEAAEIEAEANRVITSNLKTEVRHTTPEERADLVYRSKIDLEGDVRIVIFPGVDVCACCAPHVRRTGEIGILKVVSVMNYKGGVRVSILCGKRALELFAKDHDRLNAISGALTTSCDNAYAQVVKMKEELRALKASLHEASVALLLRDIAELPEGEPDAFLFRDGLETDDARKAVNAMTGTHAGISGVFIGNDERGYSFILGSKTADCREVMKILKAKFGAKGGGKAEMVQGSLKAPASGILESVRGTVF